MAFISINIISITLTMVVVVIVVVIFPMHSSLSIDSVRILIECSISEELSVVLRTLVWCGYEADILLTALRFLWSVGFLLLSSLRTLCR